MQGIGRFGLEIYVISNGVEKYVNLMFSKYLVSVDITQFIIIFCIVWLKMCLKSNLSFDLKNIFDKSWNK